jgi:hypothetical protein
MVTQDLLTIICILLTHTRIVVLLTTPLLTMVVSITLESILQQLSIMVHTITLLHTTLHPTTADSTILDITITLVITTTLVAHITPTQMTDMVF